MAAVRVATATRSRPAAGHAAAGRQRTGSEAGEAAQEALALAAGGADLVVAPGGERHAGGHVAVDVEEGGLGGGGHGGRGPARPRRGGAAGPPPPGRVAPSRGGARPPPAGGLP